MSVKQRTWRLRIIQTLSNPESIFHLKNTEQKCSMSFLKMQISGGVAFYFSPPVWITGSVPREAKGCGCGAVSGGAGRLQTSLSEAAAGPSLLPVAARQQLEPLEPDFLLVKRN